MTIYPSACVWFYRTSIAKALEEIKQTAFHYVDIETDTLDDPEALQALKDLGLKVSCVALDHKLPPGSSLVGKGPAAQRTAVDFIKQALEKSHRLGARAAYVCSCSARKQLKQFAGVLAELAEDASHREIKLCVEHVPGSALATAGETLEFLQQENHPNLHLLLDTGHALISREKPWEIISAAGGRLGYVHMNDNDGKNDRHWALLDGLLTLDDLTKILEALQQIDYPGTLGLELKWDRASAISGLSKNRNLLLRLQEAVEPKSLQEPESRRKP